MIPFNTRVSVPAALILLLSVVTQAEPITTESLIREMADLERLADFPDPPYKTVQFSSYDHRSTLPGESDWFANADGFGNEPIPNFEAVLREPGEDRIGEYLVCDVEGPGAIVRTWSARIEGTLRVYLDGNPQALYDGPAEAFFKIPYIRFLRNAGIMRSELSGTFTQRSAAYCPVPFKKRCRIVWEGNKARVHFYQVQMRLYPDHAQVVTFTPEDVKRYAAAIGKTIAALKTSTPARNGRPSQEKIMRATLAPGEKREILSVEGPGAFTRFELKLAGENITDALRQTLLRISFDGQSRPQIEAPVGDFFGAAPGINPYTSLPFTVDPDGTMTCRFVMPFRKSVAVSLENLGEGPVEAEGVAAIGEYDWDAERSMYFHARWQSDGDITGSNTAVQDLAYLQARGKGVYVGSAAYIMNPCEVPTSRGNWWGEGDEKIFVDDDVRPSTFGTGSEDYFNYAWSSANIFFHPYCAQPRNDGPANRGFVANNRWHIVDPLPFQSRIDFYMELYPHETVPGMAYSRVAYYYGRPGAEDSHRPITKSAVPPPRLPSTWTPAPRGAAGRSIFYQIVDIARSKKSSVVFKTDGQWAGGRLWVWNPSRKAGKVKLTFPVEKSGNYYVRLTVAKSPRGGRFSARLDGADAGFAGKDGVVDLYEAYRTLSRTVSSKRLRLAAGKHVLTITGEGKHPQSHGAEIGIDFLWVQRR